MQIIIMTLIHVFFPDFLFSIFIFGLSEIIRLLSNIFSEEISLFDILLSLFSISDFLSWKSTRNEGLIIWDGVIVIWDEGIVTRDEGLMINDVGLEIRVEGVVIRDVGIFFE